MDIHPKTIGFDIDGVVADTMEAFIRLAADRYGVTVDSEDITEFQVEDCLDMEQAVVDEIFGLLLEDPFAAGLQPMPCAVVVLREFAEIAPLTFITARPQRRPIEKWLEKWLGPDASAKTRLIATGEHDGKASYIKDMGLRYFVDDRAQTCIRLCKEGIAPFVFSQPWNRGKHHLPEVENWQAIRQLCFGPHH